MAEALRRLLAPLEPYRSPGRARIALSVAGAAFDHTAAELEGFARPLWGLVPAALGGLDIGDWATIREGLDHGTDPAHPEFWGWPGDLDQRLVELAAVGFALLAVPERIWDPLPAAARARVAAYLRHAMGCRFSPNNWMFFRLLMAAGLRRVGEDAPDCAAERAGLDALYLGDGWYRDGPGRRVDHYVGFAFHTYGLLLHRFDPEARTTSSLDHARLFLPQFARWFDTEGRGLPFGRSMTYRFAVTAAFGAYALADSDPVLPWGVLKSLVMRNLRWWATQPIADRDGVLSVGFAYPNVLVAETYSSAGSPYWALKAFLPLALPATHPFWTVEEQPLPGTDEPVAQPVPGFLIQSLADQTVALVAGQESRNFRHGDEKYAKFAYSTRFPLCVEDRGADLRMAALDGMLGIEAPGRPWTPRRGCLSATLDDGAVHAVWHPYDDVEVETWLVPWGRGHLRVHRISSAVALDTVEGGFAAKRRDGSVDETEATGPLALVRSTSSSLIRDLSPHPRQARVHSPEPNVNLAFPRCWIPQLVGPLSAGVTLLACFCAAGDDVGPCDGPLPNPGSDLLSLLAPKPRRAIGAMTGAAAV